MTDFDLTEDVFQRGRFVLVQPKKGAHRAGLDALLLSSLLQKDFTGHVVDLGSGAGAIGLAIAARPFGAVQSVKLIENDPQMVTCAQQSIKHSDNKVIAEKISLAVADITKGANALEEAGILQNSIDAVLTNPPYNLDDMQPSAHESRAKAHQADAALLEDWFRAATAILKPKGFLALIIRPQCLTLILNILDRRFGDIKIIPVHAHYGEEAIRILITGRKASKAPLKMSAGLVLHDKASRAYRPEIDDLINGKLTYDDILA